MTSDFARRLARAAVFAFVCALVVSLLALLVRERADALVGFDENAVRAATDFSRAHPVLLQFLIAWQSATQPVFVYLLAVPVMAWVARGRSLPGRAAWAFVTAMVVWASAALMKEVVQRARPAVDDPVSHAGGYSFPSGHSANAMGAALVMVVLLWPLLTRGGRIAAVLLAVAFVAITGADRVLLGVHYPSDVIGGFLLGAAMVGASYRGYAVGHGGAPDQADRSRPSRSTRGDTGSLPSSTTQSR